LTIITITQKIYTFAAKFKPNLITRMKPKLYFPCLLLLIQLVACKKENTSTNPDLKTVTAKENLVAWYKFTNGNTADYSDSNNHLTAYNATPTTDYKGRPNNAYAFNGFNSYMQATNSNSLSPSKITLAALIKPEGYYTGSGSASRILMKGADDQSNGVYFLGFYNTGSFYGTYGDNQHQSNGVITADNSLQLNTWYKLIYTYDGSIGKLYINGTLVNQTNSTAAFTPNSDFLRVGVTGRSDYPYWFNGVIDEIRIYNIDLTQDQVVDVAIELGED